MTTQSGPQLSETDKASEDAKTEVKKTTAKKEPSAKKKKPPEKFYRLFIHEKQNEQDLDYVPVGVNGDVLQITRGTEVVVPERFKEVMENAKYPVYRVEPGKRRKVTSWVRKVPFDVRGEATRKEYLDMRSKGTEAHKEALEQAEKEAENK